MLFYHQFVTMFVGILRFVHRTQAIFERDHFPGSSEALTQSVFIVRSLLRKYLQLALLAQARRWNHAEKKYAFARFWTPGSRPRSSENKKQKMEVRENFG